MLCANCGSENLNDAKFYGECGADFAATCPECGTANEAGRRFCYEYGTPLNAASASAATPI
jgi:uncharacterized membrane protein YvbJ